jgi:hypothetical protein
MQHFNGALKIIDWSPDGDAIATIARCDRPVDLPALAELGSVALLKAELDRLGIVSKRREGAGGSFATDRN